MTLFADSPDAFVLEALFIIAFKVVIFLFLMLFFFFDDFLLFLDLLF